MEQGIYRHTLTLREGLNKKRNQFGGFWWLPIPPKLFFFTSQNDPNALKHEIDQYKYFPNYDPYPPSHLEELAMTSIHP